MWASFFSIYSLIFMQMFPKHCVICVCFPVFNPSMIQYNLILFYAMRCKSRFYYLEVFGIEQ